ncbi:MAG: hypothetical protein KDK61_08700, partial [Simkania sp.]|nr:hypothetical protein [Simkania sp.]
DRTTLLEIADDYNNGSIRGLVGTAKVDLSQNGPDLNNEYVFSVEFVDYPWYVTAWQSVKTLSPCTLIFFILSFLVLVFGIIGVIKTSHHEHFSSNNLLALIFLILLIIAGIFVFMNFGLPKSPYTSYDTESNSTTSILMVEDKAKTLDASEFFFDPDDNLVDFDVASYESEFLSVTKEDAYLTLTPRPDWYGNTSLRLVVTDAYNESAVSPEINVEVLPVEDYTFFELFTMFCEYLNLVVLMLLFVVIYVAFSFHPRPKERQLTLSQTVEKKEEKKAVSKKQPAKKKSSKKKPAKKAKNK